MNREILSSPTLRLEKSRHDSSHWSPLESGKILIQNAPKSARLKLSDAHGRLLLDAPAGKAVSYTARGSAGWQRVWLVGAAGETLAETGFLLQANTRIACTGAVQGRLAERLAELLCDSVAPIRWKLRGKVRRMFVSWGRDHVHSMKAMKYFESDIRSGIEYWLETQEPNGMCWDCIHQNPNGTAPSWFGEALGEGFYHYEENGKYIVRRIPVEADCEFLYAEGVWQAWKASGDDAWMASQLPRLETALAYNSSHPDRWSEKHQLVRRSMCMDSWDFANPHYCAGDHRRIDPGDPQFLFHGDNSGLYSFYLRLAEMWRHLGNSARADELLAMAAAFRERANANLFSGKTYGHMIPETFDEAEVYATVGDERKRMSFSLGYTINRGLPDHNMALSILREYQRRGKAKQRESFAEWFAMDPPYSQEQWPQKGTGKSLPGDYMNGGISPVVAGELARAAFEHGMEDYGADILRRVWALTERDGGQLHNCYRQAPENPKLPPTLFRFLDLRAAANRGLRHGAHPDVPAWTDEGDNDMRNLPTGARRFGAIRFKVIDPERNHGKSIVHLRVGESVEIPATGKARSLYFLHAAHGAARAGDTAAVITVRYADGEEREIDIRLHNEIGRWWNPTETPDRRHGAPLDSSVARVAWRGVNPTWKDVGVYMFGWNNPRPDAPIRSLNVSARRGDYLLLAASAADQPVAFEPRIRSWGLPDDWGQAAVYHAIAEGLAGIEDRGRGFDRVRISPRWPAAGAGRAEVCLYTPASGAYCAYRWTLNRSHTRITLDLAGDFQEAELRILLPKGRKAAAIRSGTEPLPFSTETVEQSRYAVLRLTAPLRAPLRLDLKG
jgi:hypothetical protein